MEVAVLTLSHFLIKTFSLGAICATLVYAHYLIQELIHVACYIAAEIKNVIYWHCMPLKGPSSAIHSAQWSLDGKSIISGSIDGSTHIWNAKNGKSLCILQEKSTQGRHTALSFDGAYIAATAQDELVLYTTTCSPYLKHIFKSPCGCLNKIAFSRDNCSIAAGTENGRTFIWDIRSGELLCTLQGHTDGITALSWSYDSKYVITASWDGTSRIWSAATGETIHILHDIYDTFFITRVLPRSTAYVLQLQISPYEQTIATGSVLGTVTLWDQKTGAIIERFTNHTGAIQALSFSPKANLLASASTDDTVCIWDITQGDCIATLTGHSDGARALAFSPDGSRLISADGDGTIFAWDTLSGNCLHTIHGHTDRVSSLIFSPDGLSFLSASYDGKVKIWYL
jgi:WD40 repeat protein